DDDELLRLYTGAAVAYVEQWTRRKLYMHFFSQMGEWTLSCVALIVAIVGLRWVCTRTTSALPQGD
ncbi:hypothetical protein MJI70_19940, partial [Salmonella enterica subsp. enterica serovar Montevideo]|nr:hypothetical protein [Salmonella enterica subsp. enterica serovar Montevideo]